MGPESLNLATLDALREFEEPGKKDFIREVVEAYLDDTATRLEAARDAQETGDSVALSKQAHAIKGSSLNVGAELLASLAQAMEKECKANSLSPLAEVEEMKAEFQRVRSALLAYCRG